MAPLFRFLVLRAAAGFGIGFAVGGMYIQVNYGFALFVEHPIAAALLLWSFGASFALGVIGTGLARNWDR